MAALRGPEQTGKGVNCFVDAVPLTDYKQYLQTMNLKVHQATLSAQSLHQTGSLSASQQQWPLQTHTLFGKASRDLWLEQPLRRLFLHHKKPKDKCYAPTTGSHAKGAGLFKEVWAQNSIWNNCHMPISP